MRRTETPIEWTLEEYSTKQDVHAYLCEVITNSTTQIKPFFDYDCKYEVSKEDFYSCLIPEQSPSNIELEEWVTCLKRTIIKTLKNYNDDTCFFAIAYRKPAFIKDTRKQSSTSASNSATTDTTRYFYKISLRFFVNGLKTTTRGLKAAVKLLNIDSLVVDETMNVEALEKLKSKIESTVFDISVYDSMRKMNCVGKCKTREDVRILEKLPGYDALELKDFLIQYVQDSDMEVEYPVVSRKRTSGGEGTGKKRTYQRRKKSTSNTDSQEVSEKRQKTGETTERKRVDLGAVPPKLADFLMKFGVLPKKLGVLKFYEPDQFVIDTTELACVFIADEHRSNHQYFVIHGAKIQRRCYDENCTDKMDERILSEEVINELKELTSNPEVTIDPALLEAALEEAKQAHLDIDEGNENMVLQSPKFAVHPFQLHGADVVAPQYQQGVCPDCKSKCAKQSKLASVVQMEENELLLFFKCTDPNCVFSFPRNCKFQLDKKVYANLHQLFVQINIQINNTTNHNYFGIGESAATDLKESMFFEDRLTFYPDNPETNRLLTRALVGTDRLVADFFYSIYKDKIYHWKKADEWYRFENGLWVKGNIASVILLLSDTEFQKFFQQAETMYETLATSNKYDEESRLKKLRRIKTVRTNLQKQTYANNVVLMSRGLFSNGFKKFIKLLDSNKNLIGFDNGVYDLNQGLFRASLSTDFLSKTVGYDYDEEKLNNPDVRMKVLQFLDQIFPKTGLTNYIIKYFSTSLSGFVKDQIVLIGVGDGRNGKSALMGLMAKTLGEYAKSLDSSFLCGKSPDAAAATPSLTKLVGCRFVYASEIDDCARLNPKIFKGMCGNDSLQYRPLFGEAMDFVPDFKMFMICNPSGMPKFDASDIAMTRRIRVVPFDSKFKTGLCDPTKLEFPLNKSLEEAFDTWKYCFMGLLLQGYQDYKTTGLDDIPTAIVDKTNETLFINDIGLQFLHSCYDKVDDVNDKTGWIKPEVLFKHFQEWAAERKKRIDLTVKGNGYVVPPLLKQHITITSKNIRVAGKKTSNNFVVGWKLKD